MFNTDRLPRWLTVAAVVVLFAAVVATGIPHVALLAFPPIVALPFIAHAAIHRTDRAIALGLGATRVTGWLMLAWGLITTLAFLFYGLPVLVAAILLLATAGSRNDERRLATVTMLIGGLGIVAMVLLVWMGVHPVANVAAALGLIAGGGGWLGEARRAPLTTETLPMMTVAA